MNNNEVNDLLNLEKSGNLNHDKTEGHIRIKLKAFSIAFQTFENKFLKACSTTSDTYDFIPFSSSAFVDILIEAAIHFKMDRSKSFLDIGSGPGTKVMLANVFFDKAQGIELRSDLISKANALGIQGIIQGDVLQYQNYKDYDFLYFYRPFKNDDLQLALEEIIFDQMKKGALIAPMGSVMDWDSCATKLSQYIYLKE